jgi:hypothetical protein
MRTSRTGIVISALPSVLMLAMFYSLAFHMYRSLGAWPASIGERGFPPSLLAHANVALYFFITLIWFGMFIWPVAVLVSLMVPRWRRAVPYLALYAVLFLVCWGIMQLAPEQFLLWWGD